MKYQDYSDLFDTEPATLACLSTFNFDPDFFERRLLRTAALDRARRIVVFMDAQQWQLLRVQDAPTRWLNRRYLVVPVKRPAGVFHPKVNLLIGETTVVVHCGSANLSRAGCTHNLELLNVFNVSSESNDGQEVAFALARDALGMFESCVDKRGDEAGRIAAQWLKETKDEFAWLTEKTTATSRPIRLIHTFSGSLWERLLTALGADRPSKLLIISPYFDPDAEMFRRIRSQWPECRLEVIVQQGTSALPVTALKPLRTCLTVNVIGNASRRLHGKLLAFQCKNRSLILAGSANFTTAAFDGRNTEACLLLETTGDVADELFDGQFTKQRIRLEDFEPGPECEPMPLDDVPEPLRIHEAVLLANEKVRATYRHNLPDRPNALAIAIRCAGEPRPRASIPIPNRQEGEVTVDLPKNSLAEAHGALLVSLVAEIATGRQESLPIWAIQEERLTHEPSEGRGTDKRRIVEDTGTGLAEYLDELGKNEGTAAVIEYLKHLNIRFHDGGGDGRKLPFRIERHDPFHPDTRPEWMLPEGQPSSDLQAAIYDFVDRHERGRLRRHAQRGNLNGVENFLDIFTAVIRLLYVYLRRGVVEKSQFVGRVCQYIQIATDGFENANEACSGYLDTLAGNMQGDTGLLRKVCREANFGGIVRAAFFACQKVRFDPAEAAKYGPKASRASECLPIASRALQGAFVGAGLAMPTADDVAKALAQYTMVPAEELPVWIVELDGYRGRAIPGDATAAQEMAVHDHRSMQELQKVALFKLRRSKPSSAQCLAWAKKELEEVGVTWSEWVWMLRQYGHDPDVKERADHLVKVICGAVQGT